MATIIEKIIMYALGKVIEWATSPENVKKIKDHIKAVIKEKADREGKDIWDYLYELFKDV